MRPRTQLDVERLKGELLQRREVLLGELKAAARAHQPVEVDESCEDQFARVDALQTQAIALEAERRHRGELQRIEAALRRLEDGEYGHCVTCGEEIAPQRLDLDPAAAICINCARTAPRR